MHSVLFVATIPAQHEVWVDFVQYAAKQTAENEAAARLSENVWLLNLQKSVAPLGWLVAKAEQKGIAYGLLPFERAPEWLPAAFDPNTN